MDENKVNAASGCRQSDIILSTRVRLARNIEGLPFPVRLNNPRRSSVNSRCCKALEKEGLPLRVIDMSSLYPYERISLAERHLISPEFASSSDGRILLLSEDERISIMLNEDDHIRIQALENGLTLQKAYENAALYDDALDKNLHFAFDPKLGYLNQNFSDIGAGMKASVMMHLPALSRTGVMTGIASMLLKLGMNIRGSYGDAASVKGDIYRISNQVTLGITEEQAIENLEAIAMQIATKERAAAEELVKDISIRDKINRSEALLRGAVLLTADEMMELLSWVRLGALNSLSDTSPEEINKLFVSMQPATVNVLAGKKLPSSVRDEIRAKKVKEKLFSNRN